MEPVHIMTAGELIVYSVMFIVTGVLFVCVFLAPDEKGNSMLVLTRKPEPNHDTILIGDRIRIQIQGIIGGKVKIGIDAPPDLRVLRGELVELEPIVGSNIPQTFRPNMEREIDHAGEIMADSRS